MHHGCNFNFEFNLLNLKGHQNRGTGLINPIVFSGSYWRIKSECLYQHAACIKVNVPKPYSVLINPLVLEKIYQVVIEGSTVKSIKKCQYYNSINKFRMKDQKIPAIVCINFLSIKVMKTREGKNKIMLDMALWYMK